MNNAIQIKNLSFSYSEKSEKIFDDADFTLEYGKLTVLTGASGCGKSTLISVINGVIPNLIKGIFKGEVYADGKDIKNLRISERAAYISTVLQNPDEQIFHEKCDDEVAFGCENLNMEPQLIQKQTEKSIREMDLDPNSLTKKLSGGQKQRLITASVFAMNRKIIILDEPLANLDCKSSVKLLKFLRDKANHGYAVLIVEHRLDMVCPYADRICTFKNGKIVDSDFPISDAVRTVTAIHVCSSESNAERNTVISLDNISYSVKEKDIIKNLSLNIYRGEKLVIAGENGCGKTTLLRLLACIIKPTDGVFRQNLVKSLRQRKCPPAWFRKIGYVYQNPSYQLIMSTVREEIECCAESREKTEECLKIFGLAGLESRHPQSLSEGQKRRLGIAAVCASGTEIIFLDEPTVGQDSVNLEKTVKALEELHKKTGCTTVTVTHDIRCAETLCTRSILIKDGTVYEEGGRENLKKFITQSTEK